MHPSTIVSEDVFTGQRHDLSFLQGRKVSSLSGIAQPESFEESLVTLGAELVYRNALRIITSSPRRKCSHDQPQ